MASKNNSDKNSNTAKEDINSLLACLAAEFGENHSTIVALADQIASLQAEKERMSQKLLYFERQQFGRRSEKRIEIDPAQLRFSFEGEAEIEEELSDIKTVLEEIQVRTQERREKEKSQKRTPSPKGSKRLPEHLERRERVIEPEGLNPDDYVRIGEDRQEFLHRSPATFYVEVIIRPIYKLKSSTPTDIETKIHQAPLVEGIIPRSIATADLLSYLLVSKYTDHLPVYRQQTIFKRQGVDLADGTLFRWFAQAADMLEPLYRTIVKSVLELDYVQVDESTIPVINDEKKRAVKAYLWGVRAMTRPMHFFHYDKGSRAQYVIISLLKNFRGTIQTDGYDAYSIYENKEGITLLGCWAHARRYFEKALGEDHANASVALEFIGKLYEVEKNLVEQEANLLTIFQERIRLSGTVIKAFEKWMIDNTHRFLPKSLMRKAISYAFSMLPRLARYLYDGRYQIDNNPIERTFRPLAVGRKNYLFCENHESAENTAMFYTFLGCCSQAGCNPQEWLTDVLGKIKETSEEELTQLIPCNWKENRMQKEQPK